MRCPGRDSETHWLFLALAALGLASVAATTTEAARASADVVLVREGEVVEEDLYAAANVVTIDGVIEGDLVFWAFERLEIRGEVQGDVVGFAPTARITGQVGGSVRLIGLDISTAGEVGADVFAVGWRVQTAGSIGRDVLAWARSLSIDGSVGRDVEGQTWGPTRISGAVGRDVEMTVQSMTLVDTAYVAEDLGYRSLNEAVIGENAGVGGAIVRRSPVMPNVSVSAARMVAAALAFMGFLWIGILTIWLAPSTLDRAVRAARDDLSRSFLAGLAAWVAPMVLIIAMFLIAALAPPELAFTILAVGTPVWLGLLAALLIAAVVAPVPVFIVLGRRVSRGRWSAFGAFFALSVPYALTMLFVPYVRVVVVGVVVIVGTGALVRGAAGSRGSLSWAAGRLPSKRDPQAGESGDIEHPAPPSLYAVDAPEDDG